MSGAIDLRKSSKQDQSLKEGLSYISMNNLWEVLGGLGGRLQVEVQFVKHLTFCLESDNKEKGQHPCYLREQASQQRCTPFIQNMNLSCSLA